MCVCAQSMLFIAADREMYHAETDTPALARTSNLNEELGMVREMGGGQSCGFIEGRQEG